MLKLPFLALIKAYQLFISPLLGKNCRFDPSCSEYTYTCIQKHGIIKGIYYGLKQISKCHPFYNPKEHI